MRDSGSGSGGSDLEIELGVIGIAIEWHTMPADDTIEGEHVDVKEGWTKNRALEDPTSESVKAASGVPHGHRLSPFCKIGLKPK